MRLVLLLMVLLAFQVAAAPPTVSEPLVSPFNLRNTVQNPEYDRLRNALGVQKALRLTHYTDFRRAALACGKEATDQKCAGVFNAFLGAVTTSVKEKEFIDSCEGVPVYILAEDALLHAIHALQAGNKVDLSSLANTPDGGSRFLHVMTLVTLLSCPAYTTGD